MADIKNPPKTSEVKKPIVDAPKPVEVKVDDAPKTASGKEKRPVQQSVFPTADAAIAEANKRTYGPRKAYTVSVGGKTVHCVAYGPQYAAYEAFVAANGTINDLGGTTRAPKPIGEDALVAALAGLSDEKRKALEARLAALKTA